MCDSDMDCSDDEMDYYYDGKYQIDCVGGDFKIQRIEMCFLRVNFITMNVRVSMNIRWVCLL